MRFIFPSEASSLVAGLAFCAAVALGAGCNSQSAPSSTARSDERAILDYAKPVAEAFLDTIKSGRLEAAMDLITKDYERRLKERRPANFTPDLAFRDAVIFPMVQVYKSDTTVYEQMAAWEIRSTVLSPDRKEVASEGAFRMKDGKEFKFRLLVREEPDGGKWRVDAMTITP
jgi:hypothetical protein